ncbi:MAG: RnfH family protein [Candidatus Accumulibacter sp.]|jgi:putative ubiquitin-RnfH superfamily antitoxin RatB of RatAB toxin-antitoxin module|nr:RnfH family protein [Accumulibacter sp.]
MADSITVEVVYALEDRQELVTLTLPAGATAREAVARSGLLEKFPEIDLAKNKLGVFARLVRSDAALRDGDRVEIYRPLIADPKEVRKRRVAEGKAMKKGVGEQES